MLYVKIGSNGNGKDEKILLQSSNIIILSKVVFGLLKIEDSGLSSEEVVY